jgi:acetyl-CoA carboxylase biotin carboxylase subunit
MMGNKSQARREMIKSNVPVVPGSDDCIEGIEEGLKIAESIGYPVIIKASSGGGGKGMRVAYNSEEFKRYFLMCQAESKAAFGDDSVYVEKYLESPRHIEFQILGDNSGNVVYLGERDCSIQRKHQKVIEEAPSIALGEELRERMGRAAVTAARAVNYVNAGTVEFLLDSTGNFYFMEMNTRIQVEHPVTEYITGVDLVKEQIRIAMGYDLSMRQEDIRINGHAIECRINAENPYQNFRPSCGKIEMLHIPGGPWVRFDTAVYQGYSIPPFYDSMIGKLIVLAKTRDEALRKMKAALCELIIEGIDQNADFLSEILSSEEFENSSYTTDFLSNLIK